MIFKVSHPVNCTTSLEPALHKTKTKQTNKQIHQLNGTAQNVGDGIAQILGVQLTFFPSQSLGVAKTGDPREKPPDHPQAEFGLSHMRPELSSNTQWWDHERLRALKISDLITTRPRVPLKEYAELIVF